jgi:hypothetical protein
LISWDIYKKLSRLFQTVAVLCVLGGTVPALAIPPEGLEAFTLLSGTKYTIQPLYIQAGYNNPSWLSDYEALQFYVSVPNGHGNYFTYGAMVSTGSQWADRDGYFIRYDQTFSGQSFSFKLAHIDYRYLNAGKNTFSLAYNNTFRLGKFSHFYLSIGGYYRFSLHNWHSAPWNPLGFNTDDREFYFEGCFGTQIDFGRTTRITLDLNNRDPFFSYNGDNLAFDLGIYLGSSKNLTWRAIIGHRFSGLLVGTADIGEQYGFLGIISEL